MGSWLSLEAVADYPNPTRSQIDKFTMPMLKGVLLRDDGHRWESEHSKLKTNAELKAAVLLLYPDQSLAVVSLGQSPEVPPIAERPPTTP